MDSFKNITLNIDQGIGHLTIQRSDCLNALNRSTIEDMLVAVEKIKVSFPVARVLVIAGAGEKAFVAGADISEMSTLQSSSAQAFSELGQKLTLAIESLPQVVIAKVQGFALGGGCELVMACDVVIASENAKFSQPEVGLGLIPGFGGSQRLVRRVGLAVGLEMLCAGRVLTGAEAAQLDVPAAEIPQTRESNQAQLLAAKTWRFPMR